MPKSTALGLKQEKSGARLCQRGACPRQNPANEPIEEERTTIIGTHHSAVPHQTLL
jgi:hypothetical protein